MTVQHATPENRPQLAAIPTDNTTDTADTPARYPSLAKFSDGTFDGNLTIAEVACILDALAMHAPIRSKNGGIGWSADQADNIEAGRSVLLSFLSSSLTPGRDRAFYPDEEVTWILSFLNSQQYLRGSEYAIDDMEAARALILGWCQWGLHRETEAAITRSTVEAVAS